ncbi:MAG: hypothetical protein ACI9XO_002044 [Paraglaciecola sp.]|jgi:hypothetical protein
MKNIMVIAMQLVLCLSLSASNINTTPNNCDWTASNLNETLNLYDKVYNHLAADFWIVKTTEEGLETLIQFHESGRIDWISYAKKSKVTNTYNAWHLDFCSEKTPFLTLKKEGETTEQCFKLERTCDGIVLTNYKTKENIILEKKSAKEVAVIKAVKISLAGNWSNATYPFDISKNRKGNGTRKAMKTAYLKMVFQRDGTYFKKYGSEKMHLIEKGTWEISRNGQFVFMENNGKISVAKVQHLDLDEMVLEWQLDHPQNTDFSTTVKSFVFIR